MNPKCETCRWFTEKETSMIVKTGTGICNAMPTIAWKLKGDSCGQHSELTETAESGVKVSVTTPAEGMYRTDRCEHCGMIYEGPHLSTTTGLMDIRLCDNCCDLNLQERSIEQVKRYGQHLSDAQLAEIGLQRTPLPTDPALQAEPQDPKDGISFSPQTPPKCNTCYFCSVDGICSHPHVPRHVVAESVSCDQYSEKAEPKPEGSE